MLITLFVKLYDQDHCLLINNYYESPLLVIIK